MANVISNYVKFKRGTPSAFEKLSTKDSDTLYFIYEEDELSGELYLGSKLIAGSGEFNGVTTLNALTDVLISENLNADSFLIYDITKNKWVDMPIEDILSNFVGTTGLSDGVAGLVPAPKATQVNMFLRSDGQWAEIVTASAAQVLQTIVAFEETHMAAIARILSDRGITTPQKGDIVVLKELIVDDTYQHISYIYDGIQWIAMDGNYDAENVYLAEDLVITADIGVQKLDGAGSKKLETAGKNLKQVLNMILASRLLPTYIRPSVAVECPEAGEYEVGSTVVPTYTATFDKGSYEFAPGAETGVEVESWTAEFNGQIVEFENGEFEPVVITDDFNQVVKISAVHSAGVAPEDNLGNIVEDATDLAKCQIPSGTKTANSQAIKSYRNIFYGSNTSAIELNSDNIRMLEKQPAPAINTEVDVAVVEGSRQVIIAVPEGREILKIVDEAAFGTDILRKFKIETVVVAGAAEGYDMNYTAYKYEPAVALGKNTYAVIMG